MTLEGRIHKPGQKKILALDGGIRGMMTIEVLARIEQDLLCRTFGNCLAGDKLDRDVGNMMGKE